MVACYRKWLAKPIIFKIGRQTLTYPINQIANIDFLVRYSSFPQKVFDSLNRPTKKKEQIVIHISMPPTNTISVSALVLNGAKSCRTYPSRQARIKSVSPSASNASLTTDFKPYCAKPCSSDTCHDQQKLSHTIHNRLAMRACQSQPGLCT